VELGYAPRRAQTSTVGVLLPEVRSQYYAELMHILEDGLREEGYASLCMLTGFTRDRVERAFDALIRQNVSGIIVSEAAYDRTSPGLYTQKRNVPVVILSELDSEVPIDSIYIDQQKIMNLAVEHLFSLGHIKIGYVGERLSDVRYRAFVKALDQNGLKLDMSHIKIGAERFELGGYLRAKELLQESSLPTAVIGSYDQVAIGAIKAFAEAGLKVPKHMSVMGVDNIVMDDYMATGLTSITNPVGQMGIVAVKLLKDIIKDPASHVVQHVALQSKLVIRDSTAPCGG
jgi:LacI family transcriptional regulator